MKHYQISIDDYHVIVSDERIENQSGAIPPNVKNGEPVYRITDKSVFKQNSNWYHNNIYVGDLSIIKKVLYQSKPVHEGIPLFVPVGVDEDIMDIAQKKFPNPINRLGVDIRTIGIDGFIYGYNEAKEKYRFTEEDMRMAILKAWDNSEDTKNIDDIIQQLTAPKTYEVVLEEEKYNYITTIKSYKEVTL